MKKFLLLIAAFACCAQVWGATFQEGNTAYQAGDFKKALQIYESLDAKQKSGELYYNLGNAYFRLNQKARALISYERAKMLLPRDTDVRWNLAIAHSLVRDQLETPSESFAVYALRQITDWMNLDEAAALFFMAVSLLLISAVLGFVFIPLKALWRFLQALCVVAAVLSGILLAAKIADGRNPRLIITDAEVTARFGPSKTETSAFVLHEGTQARRIDESRDWMLIQLPNKNTGWIPKSAGELI